MTTKRKKPSVKRLKAQVWDLFSIYIRMRDCFNTTGRTDKGACITCRKQLDFKELQAGHFIAGRHNANLFSEKGTHAQCRRCNIILHGNQLEYRRQIIRLYGEGYDEILEKENNKTRTYNVPELENLKKIYLKKIAELEAK